MFICIFKGYNLIIPLFFIVMLLFSSIFSFPIKYVNAQSNSNPATINHVTQSSIPNSFKVTFDGLEASSPCNQCTFQATTTGSFTLTFKSANQLTDREELPKGSDSELEADGKGFISINAQKTVDKEDCRFKFSNDYIIKGNAIYRTPVKGDEHDHGGINVYDIHAYPNEAYATLVKGKESICYGTWLTSPGALLTCDSVFINLAVGSGKVEKNDDQGHKECTLQ